MLNDFKEGEEITPCFRESVSVFAGLKETTFCLFSETVISFVLCIWMLALFVMCSVVFS